jgi:Cu/Ag efflux protein CusF
MKIKKVGTALFITAGLMFSVVSTADDHGHHDHSQHGHQNGEHMEKGEHMMDQKDMGHHAGEMGAHMREVMGEGRINKVMAKHGMVNIKHDPMPEMNWPQMSMNFKTEKSVNLEDLKPGQEVDFTLLVDDDNNYVIKQITVK